MAEFQWDPETYSELVREEVPDYERIQTEAIAASRGVDARSILELGFGTGETTRRTLEAHPNATLLGLDSSPARLAAARESLAAAQPRVELELARLEDPLPDGPFDLVISALAVHHLDGPGKELLFARVAKVLSPGGRFVLADAVVPEDEADVVTPMDPGFDTPSSALEQLGWLGAAGLNAHVYWAERDLAVLVADRP
jgi:tRNA (cmo5U34)-methyltransferase